MPLIEAGRATLMAPRFVVRKQLDEGTLVALDCDWTFEVAYVAVTNKGASAFDVVRTCVRLAREIGATL